MEALGGTKECSLLLVICGHEFDYQEPLRYATDYRLALTWIFATPTSGGTPYVGLASMRAAGPRIQRFLLECRSLGIKTSPDLPVPLCVFEPEFLEEHKEEFALVRRCRPFVYLKSDLSSQFCTAMPIYSAPPVKDASQLLHVIQDYREADSILKRKPSFPECVDCRHHIEQTCQGGCMTYKAYSSPEMVV